MKANRVFALLLAVVMLLSIFTGCNTVEPGVTNPSGSIENTADHTETDGMDSTAGSAGATTGTDFPPLPQTATISFAFTVLRCVLTRFLTLINSCGMQSPADACISQKSCTVIPACALWQHDAHAW